jgi:Ni,Fe-hydrogenase III component G
VEREVADMFGILPEHRRVIIQVRRATADAAGEWARVIQRQKQENHLMLGLARRELEAQKAANRLVVAEHKRVFRDVVEQMKAEAHNYKLVYMQAKAESRRLLPLLGQRFRKAA